MYIIYNTLREVRRGTKRTLRCGGQWARKSGRKILLSRCWLLGDEGLYSFDTREYNTNQRWYPSRVRMKHYVHEIVSIGETLRWSVLFLETSAELEEQRWPIRRSICRKISKQLRLKSLLRFSCLNFHDFLYICLFLVVIIISQCAVPYSRFITLYFILRHSPCFYSAF